MNNSEMRLKIVLESKDSEMLNLAVQRIVAIIRSHDGRAMTVDPLPDGSNGRGRYRKNVAVFSPTPAIIDALTRLDLPAGVDYTVEI